VIIVKKISLSEIYKMMFSHLAYDPAKTEVYQTSSLNVRSKHVHTSRSMGNTSEKQTDHRRDSSKALNMIVP
jgi:hypothetical protein